MESVLIVVVAAAAMILTERFVRGRNWPRTRGWWPRALALSAVQVLVVWIVGIVFDPWVRAHRPWSADALGTAGGAAVGYIAVTFVFYWWHRARHASPFLWRYFHQVHHSPQRIEVIT